LSEHVEVRLASLREAVATPAFVAAAATVASMATFEEVEMVPIV
jgi:hypothetical protein